MMKRTLLLALTLLLAALLLLCACAGDGNPDGSADTTGAAETEPPVARDQLTDKYDIDVNSITSVAGTFTDRITQAQFIEAVSRGQSTSQDPLLYNIIQVMGLSREDITLYSEMNGGSLDAALIDGLFLEGAAMREALRGDYTIMAGGYPYTVGELAAMPEANLKALNIPAAELTAFLSTIPAAAEATGETLSTEVEDFLAAFGAK